MEMTQEEKILLGDIKRHGGFYTLCLEPRLIKVFTNNPSIIRLFIEEKGRLLEFVPSKKKTNELCKIAVKQDCVAIDYVPKNLFDQELSDMVIDLFLRDKLNDLTHYIPKRFINEELIERIISRKPQSVLLFDEKYATEEVLIKAIEEDWGFIEKIGSKKLNGKLVFTAIATFRKSMVEDLYNGRFI